MRYFSILAIVALFVLALGVIPEARSQDGLPSIDTQVDTSTPTSGTQSTASDSNQKESEGLNFLMLLFRGGWFMIPLALLSILVVSLAIERAIALRQEKMLPRKLVSQLGHLAADEGGFDPRQAYQVCQQNPSVAARVVQAMLLKAGRPVPEIENAVSECGQREATKLHNVVSWLTLAAAVAPLIGLLGTVWGITQAFYETTQLTVEQNKSEALAEGIYTALVTTMCGLAIAIPAAVLAHVFENRIVAWFNRIDEMVLNITPQMEPLEGRMRAATSSDSSHQSESNQNGRSVVAAEVPGPAKLPR